MTMRGREECREIVICESLANAKFPAVGDFEAIQREAAEPLPFLGFHGHEMYRTSVSVFSVFPGPIFEGESVPHLTHSTSPYALIW
jgi:hypothetical protein